MRYHPHLREPSFLLRKNFADLWTGYQYRLCPAGSDLNEDCFQAHTLDFADHTSALRWGGVGATKPCPAGGPYENCAIKFNATDVSGDLVVPVGSTWRRCPIPRAPWAWADTGASFEPVCKESEACASYHGPKFSGPGCGTDKSSCSTGTFPCQCSGWGVGDLFRLEIVDTVQVPADLPAGDWVLGWRWDWCDTNHPLPAIRGSLYETLPLLRADLRELTFVCSFALGYAARRVRKSGPIVRTSWSNPNKKRLQGSAQIRGDVM